MKKEDLKPDVLTTDLKKGFEWTTQHAKIVAIVVGIFIAGGAAYSTYDYLSASKESKFQDELYPIEKAYFQKKENFEKAVQAEAAAKLNPKTPHDASLVKATGDMEKDFGDVIVQLEAFQKKSKGSVASLMAITHLVEIYKKHNQWAKITELIEQANINGNTTLQGLVLFQGGLAHANQNACDKAVGIWAGLEKQSSLDFMKPQIHLNLGLCYEELKDFTKAEEYYGKAKAVSSDSQVGRTASKFLDHLKSKQ